MQMFMADVTDVTKDKICYKLSLSFQISGAILPRKFSLIQVFKNRFLRTVEIDAHN